MTGGARAATVVDLGTLGGAGSSAVATNRKGQVVGDAETASGASHAFSWTRRGGMIDLGTLGGRESAAAAVNDAGQVVGLAQTASGARHAFSWTASSGMIDLGTLAGTESEATAVNDAGQVVGGAFGEGNAYYRAFSWTASGGMIDLGTLGGARSGAAAVNGSGRVVGWAERSGGYERENGFSWTAGGGMVDLPPTGYDRSTAHAVNESGEAVGTTLIPGIATLWTAAGEPVNLGALPGGRFSEAQAINDSGEVVGWSDMETATETAGFRAFLWTRAGGMIDLGPYVTFRNSDAHAISDSGQVVGSGEFQPPYYEQPFSWTQGRGMTELPTPGNFGSAWALNDSGQVVGFGSPGPGPGPVHAMLWYTSPPQVSTTAASATGPTKAVVKGSANPEEQLTTLHADYALAGGSWCTSHGGEGAFAESASETIGSGGVTIDDLAVHLRGLQGGREYCAELVAQNGSGTAQGGQVSFKTPVNHRHRHQPRN